MGNIVRRYLRMEENNTQDNDTQDTVLKPLRIYFQITCHCWLFEHPAKHVLYRLCQAVVATLAIVYFVYTLGVWGSDTYDLCKIFYYFPVTYIEGAMWEVRWLVTCLLGIVLTKGIWTNIFDKPEGKPIALDSRREPNRWKNVKRFTWILGGALFMMWILSVVQNFSEIHFKLNRRNVLPVIGDQLACLLDRLFAFPLFLLFCITMHVLCCMVEEFCDEIKVWPKRGDNGGELKARQRFQEIKSKIRIAGHSFELYLMVHFLLLVCTFFLGVCSCFERMEVRIAKNYTVEVPFQIPHYARYIHFYGYGNLTLSTVTGAPAAHSTGWQMLSPSYVQMTRSKGQGQGKDAFNGVNNTSTSLDLQDDDWKTKWLKESMHAVLFCSFVKTVESILLYFVPIGLMVRLQNRLRRVYEVIEDCNYEENENLAGSENGLLFDNVDTIRRMCKYVKTAHGLKIFGYTVPTFEAFMLAAFGPFAAVIIQGMLSHIHMKE